MERELKSLWWAGTCAVEDDKPIVIERAGEYWVLSFVKDLHLLVCRYKRSEHARRGGQDTGKRYENDGGAAHAVGDPEHVHVRLGRVCGTAETGGHAHKDLGVDTCAPALLRGASVVSPRKSWRPHARFRCDLKEVVRML